MIQAILLAGGKGTRLAPLTDHLPKPLVPILGVPMIEYVLRHLRLAGVTEVVISVAHLGHMIEHHLGDGRHLGMHISYIREEPPMGTGGWLRLVRAEDCAPDVLVLNADNLFWIDLAAFLKRHQSTWAIATIAGIKRPTSEIQHYEILAPNAQFTALEEYIDRSHSAEYLSSRLAAHVSSGWYILTPSAISYLQQQPWYASGDQLSMEKDVWPALAMKNHTIGFYDAKEPWFDSGTPERLENVAVFLTKHPEFFITSAP